MKILLLTNIYPMLDEEYDGTKVCHYFAREWVKQGHEVRVVRFSSLFPRPFYWIAEILKERIKAYTGAVVYTRRINRILNYVIEKIPVTVIPIFKLVPHQIPKFEILESKIRTIVGEYESIGFHPDVITAHFRNPQLMALSIFKKNYPDSRTCMVMHCNGSVLRKLYGRSLAGYMQNVDVWGFRSYAFKNEFQIQFGVRSNDFICTSGIPEDYIRKTPKKIESVRNFVFVGSLYELKRVDDTIRALAKCFDRDYFEFHIVGDGAERSRLQQLARNLRVDDRVFFEGKKDRDEVQKYMEKADVFVMVSSHEAFGLVYIEAMAKGCITIGTEGQGIDGVIVHGQNGFLTSSCNVIALANLLNEIRNMPINNLQKISNNALSTAMTMTNSKMAELYLRNILTNY